MAEVMADIVRSLTERGLQDIPAEAVEYTKRLCLSQLGAVVGGVSMSVSERVAQRAKRQGGAGESVVFGHGFKAPAAEAAFCNAIFAHATELEDDAVAPPDRTTIGTIIPAVFSLGDALGSSGAEVLEAIILGFDVQAKTAQAARTVNTRGSMAFTTGGWGTAACAAKLMKLDARQTETTMGIAASMMGGLLHQVPTMMHFMESGIGARDGILSALWAQDGITANPDIIEVHDGFWDMMRADRDGLDMLRDLLTKDFSLMRVGIKKYGCAYLMQRVVDGGLDLVRDNAIAYDDIASVELHVAPWFEEFRERRPKTVDAARFSMTFILAVIIRGDPIDLRTFSEAGIKDPLYEEAEKKVSLVFHEERGHVRFDAPDELIVRMKDGREFRKMCDVARGSPPLYLSDQEVSDKFRAAAQYSDYVSLDRMQRVEDLVLNLEKVKDVGEVTALLA